MTKQLDIDINKNTEKAKEKKKIIFDLNVEGPSIAWNEDGSFPYQTKMDAVTYELEKHLLQIELLKVQSWIQDTK
ncbi:Polyphosphate kinase 2, partial [hydrothermal vent metagenome]